MSTVYLAGKMAGLTFQQMREWRDQARKLLTIAGFKVLDPTDTELGACPSASAIVHSNKYMVNHSDLVLAELDYKKVSLGTVGEIVYAGSKGIPVLVWGGASSIIEHPWVEAHITERFPDLKQAINYIIINYGMRTGVVYPDGFSEERSRNRAASKEVV